MPPPPPRRAGVVAWDTYYYFILWLRAGKTNESVGRVGRRLSFRFVRSQEELRRAGGGGGGKIQNKTGQTTLFNGRAVSRIVFSFVSSVSVLTTPLFWTSIVNFSVTIKCLLPASSHSY